MLISLCKESTLITIKTRLWNEFSQHYWQESFDGDSFVSQSKFDAYATRHTVVILIPHFYWIVYIVEIAVPFLQRRFADFFSSIFSSSFNNSSFRYTCRGLFERHKLLFSFQMCAKILEAAGKLNMDEYNFFLRGGVVSCCCSHSCDILLRFYILGCI